MRIAILSLPRRLVTVSGFTPCLPMQALRASGVAAADTHVLTSWSRVILWSILVRNSAFLCSNVMPEPWIG
jgi:hypothetical protein